MYNSRAVNISVIVFLTVLLSFSVSAELSFESVDEPHVNLDVSNNTGFYGAVQFLDGSEPVTPENLEEDEINVTYSYDQEHENQTHMEYWTDGIYFSELTIRDDVNDTVLYEAEQDQTGGISEEDEHVVEFGDLHVEVLTDFTEPVKADSDREVEVNVTDYNGEPVEDVEVNVLFTNMTDTFEEEIRHYDSDEEVHYRSRTTMPPQTNETFLMHVTAENEDLGLDNPFGGETKMIETFPRLEGEIEYINSDSGCESSEMPVSCERGAEIDTGFNITESEAENVNLSVMTETMNGTVETQEEIRLHEEHDGLFEGGFEVPDINTSNKTDTMMLEFNATNDQREYVETYEIGYSSFVIDDRSASNTIPGDYQVELEVLKPYSLSSVDTDRVEGDVNVTDPEDEEFEAFNLSDMDFSGGSYSKDVFIPFDSSGIYSISYTVEDIYGLERNLEKEFNVEDVNQSFYINRSLDTEINKTGEHSFDLEAENLVDGDVNLTWDKQGDTEDLADISGSYRHISEGVTETIEMVLDIEFVESFSGEIMFEDQNSGYNQTLTVENEAPTCDRRDEELCVVYDDLNGTVFDTDDQDVRDLDLKYLGHFDEDKNITAQVTGEVSDYVDVDPENFTLNGTEDMETVVLEYKTESPGDWTGTLEIESDNRSIDIPVELDSEIEDIDASVTVLTDEIDLGSFVEGDDFSETIEVENDGDIEIDSLSYSSTSFDVSGEDTSIDTGETEEVQIDFEDVDSESGTVTVEASTDEGTVSDSVSVTAQVYPDFDERADDLETQAVDLDSSTSDAELSTRISEVQADISTLRTEASSENFEEAESLYDDISSELQSIETDLQQQESDNGGETAPPEEEDDVGLIIPLIIGLFVFLLVGFIAYTSIIPEKDDPLYNVLGK